MDFLNLAMLHALTLFKGFLGSYTLAIVAVTILIRVLLWPLNTAQTKSMKAMQELQPKLKVLQDKHKDNPAKMQEELMKFYAENKFNPFSGCLPMLIQLPIFFALYGALVSPEFMVKAGGESFGFIKKLHNTLQSNSGEPLDNRFNVNPNDHFTVAQHVRVFLKDNPEPQEIKVADLRINDPNKLLNIEPKPLIVGQPMQIRLTQSDLGYSDEYMKHVAAVEVPLTNLATKELELVKLVPTEKNPSLLEAQVPTDKATHHLHLDVLALIVAYGLISYAYQKSMPTPAQEATGVQAQMMKLMPLMFIGFLFFIPIPAGVLIYLLVTMAMMWVQNLWIAYNDDKAKPSQPPATQVVSVKPN